LLGNSYVFKVCSLDLASIAAVPGYLTSLALGINLIRRYRAVRPSRTKKPGRRRPGWSFAIERIVTCCQATGQFLSTLRDWSKPDQP
jgi:hypothetical protein